MSSPAPEPDRGFVHGKGVAARVEELYGAHASLVRSVCRGLLRDRNEAEDAVQQTFLSAHRALANGSLPREPAAWLATIARHECLARVRARMREPLPVDAEPRDTGPDAHADAVRRHEVGEVRDALAALPAQQRDAILLRELRGLSYEEVASTLSVTTSAVESLIFRARRSLQTRLREALAALSPGELVGRILGSGGLAVPAAAKVVALGIGAAVVTGGAVLGPRVIGLGHGPAVAQAAAPRPALRRPATTSGAQAASPRYPIAIWAVRTRQAAHESVQPERGDTPSSGGTGASQTESSDTSTSSGGGDGGQTGTSSDGTGQQTETTSSGQTGDVADTQTTTSDAATVTDATDTSSGDTTTTTTTTTTDSSGG